MKTLVVVAHPDDEIIWCGGLILRSPQWDWTVLSLCRADDPDRAPKFAAVCRALGAHGVICDLDDSNPLKPINTRREIGRRILRHFNLVHWDLCVTHGANGEYGHRRHREVHAEMMGMFQEGILDCEQLWTFAYDCQPATGSCRPADAIDVSVELSQEELGRKIRIVRDEYGYAEDSFEVRACISPESFRRWDRPGQERSQ